jgi:hypothetical protein
MHDSAKENFERNVGDAFVTWYNAWGGTSFAYERRGEDPPDLVYSDGPTILPLEITAAYYNDRFAEVSWGTVRPGPERLRFAATRDPDGGLVQSINACLKAKCQLILPPGCVLVVFLYASLDRDGFEALVPSISLPEHSKLSRIYLGSWSKNVGSSSDYWWYPFAQPC